jgi:hypothetical protein
MVAGAFSALMSVVLRNGKAPSVIARNVQIAETSPISFFGFMIGFVTSLKHKGEHV